MPTPTVRENNQFVSTTYLSFVAEGKESSAISSRRFVSQLETNALIGHRDGIMSLHLNEGKLFSGGSGTDRTVRVWDIAISSCFSRYEDTKMRSKLQVVNLTL